MFLRPEIIAAEVYVRLLKEHKAELTEEELAKVLNMKKDTAKRKMARGGFRKVNRKWLLWQAVQFMFSDTELPPEPIDDKYGLNK